MLQEDWVDRSRDEENEETPQTILTSSSRGANSNKDNIATLRREGILVYNYNKITPEDVLNY